MCEGTKAQAVTQWSEKAEIKKTEAKYLKLQITVLNEWIIYNNLPNSINN